MAAPDLERIQERRKRAIRRKANYNPKKRGNSCLEHHKAMKQRVVACWLPKSEGALRFQGRYETSEPPKTCAEQIRALEEETMGTEIKRIMQRFNCSEGYARTVYALHDYYGANVEQVVGMFDESGVDRRNLEACVFEVETAMKKAIDIYEQADEPAKVIDIEQRARAEIKRGGASYRDLIEHCRNL